MWRCRRCGQEQYRWDEPAGEAGGALCAAESMTAGREGGAMVVELTDSSGAVYEVVLAPRAAGQG